MTQCSGCGRLIKGVEDGSKHYCKKCEPYMMQVAEAQARAEVSKRKKILEWKAWIDYIPSHEIVFPDVPCKRQQGYVPFNFSNITPKASYHEVVVFDTETTGLAPSRDRIIEIAAIRYMDGYPVEKFHSYINPECPIPEAASKINHITDDMVSSAPTIGQVLPSFDEFVGSSILVAHNLEFDLKFIYYSGSHVLDIKRKYIDTLEQAQKVLKREDDVYNHKLTTLCEYYHIPMIDEHSALSDAFAAGSLFFRLVEDKQDGYCYNIQPPAEVVSSVAIPEITPEFVTAEQAAPIIKPAADPPDIKPAIKSPLIKEDITPDNGLKTTLKDKARLLITAAAIVLVIIIICCII